MAKEIQLKDTTRAMAYELWMKAPNPMVTFFKTLDEKELMGSDPVKNDTPIDIQKYVNTYVNEFRFSEITITEVEEEDYISAYAKLFMAPDFPREERLSEKTTSKYIYKVLRDREIQCNKKPIEGSFNENLNFDIQTDYYATFLTGSDPINPVWS